MRDQAHTNGIESFWALLKRGYYGTYHKMSEKHLARYIGEFAGRHNARAVDALQQMALMAQGMLGSRTMVRLAAGFFFLASIVLSGCSRPAPQPKALDLCTTSSFFYFKNASEERM